MTIVSIALFAGVRTRVWSNGNIGCGMMKMKREKAAGGEFF
jgi:hypothetical protein